MDERIQEINLHKEMLLANTVALEQQRTALARELIERQARIGMLKKRYEIIMMTVAPKVEGEPTMSTAYLIVKMAQEREALQQEGDQLDKDIKKVILPPASSFFDVKSIY